MAIPPRSGAVKFESLPMNEPIGVRLAATMKTFKPRVVVFVLNAYLMTLILVMTKRWEYIMI